MSRPQRAVFAAVLGLALAGGVGVAEVAAPALDSHVEAARRPLPEVVAEGAACDADSGSYRCAIAIQRADAALERRYGPDWAERGRVTDIYSPTWVLQQGQLPSGIGTGPGLFDPRWLALAGSTVLAGVYVTRRPRRIAGPRRASTTSRTARTPSQGRRTS